MKKLLDCKPDIDAYLASMKVTDEHLAMFGINKHEHLTTLKDLCDLGILLKALKGDAKANAVLNQTYDKEDHLAKLNRKG